MNQNRIKKINKWFIVILAFLLGILLRIFFQLAVVSGPSMMPTFQNGNWLIEDKIWNHLNYKDVVIVYQPIQGETSPYIIKRVIGLPGDRLEIKNGYLYRNGKKVIEPYIAQKMKNQAPVPGSRWSLLRHTFVVPKGDVFVMGDNRNISVDSRYFGPFPFHDIKGIVIFRIFPHPEWF